MVKAEMQKPKYPLRFKTNEEWFSCGLAPELCSGPSPGGAASDLGVTRQCIYNWVELGFLDRIEIGNGKIVFISNRSIRRVKHVLDQLRLEFETQGLHGFNVATELKKRLPQQDMFEDL